MLMSVSVEYENTGCKRVLDLDKPLKNFFKTKRMVNCKIQAY